MSTSMSTHDSSTAEPGLRPEEFAEAADAPIEAAKACELRDAARVLAEAGLIGVAAAEADGGLGLPIDFALPIAEAAGRLQLRMPLVEQILLAKAFGNASSADDGAEGTARSAIATALAAGERLGCIAWQGSLSEGMAGHARQAAQCDWVLVADEPSAAGESILLDPESRGGASLLEVASLAVEVDTALDPDVPATWLQLAERVGWWHGCAGGLRTTARGCQHPARGLRHRRGSRRHRTHRHLRRDSCAVRPAVVGQAGGTPLLARMQLVAEASAAATRRALAADEYGLGRDARPMLAGAIANAAFVLEKAIHLHGGMGFTWEMPLHRSLREIRAIDAFCGSGYAYKQIGQLFIESA